MAERFSFATFPGLSWPAVCLPNQHLRYKISHWSTTITSQSWKHQETFLSWRLPWFLFSTDGMLNLCPDCQSEMTCGEITSHHSDYSLTSIQEKCWRSSANYLKQACISTANFTAASGTEELISGTKNLSLSLASVTSLHFWFVKL